MRTEVAMSTRPMRSALPSGKRLGAGSASVEFSTSQRTAPAEAEFAVDVGQMSPHRVDRQVQLTADLLIGPASPGQAGNGPLLRAELARRDAPGAAAGPAEFDEGLLRVPFRAAAT